MASASPKEYLGSLNENVASLGRSLHDCFESEGCDSYVKTIYLGYEIRAEMVAAMYGHPDRLEVALALAEDHPDTRLKDASHLTWRTLPVALDVRTSEDLPVATELIHEAVSRIRSGSHSVSRDNEHFARAREARRSQGSGS